MFSKSKVMNIFFITIFVGMFAFILSLSAQDAQTSNALSIRVTQELVPRSVPNSYEVARSYNGMIRSLAHVVLFGILGMIVVVGLLLNGYSPLKASLTTLIIIAICALMDESLQLLSDGRAFQYSDLAKDLLGASMSIVVALSIRAWLLHIPHKKIKKEMN